ncbi:MAG: bacteriohemerythrin [Spirochaetaceae bacterium]|nr:bacteriohemerythrin [Spirochaetaceae bacterium]
MATALTAMITRIIMGSNRYLILMILGFNIVIACLMFISNHFRLYTLCRWITVVVLCDILFPLVYFALGGIDSSMAGYFVLSIVVVFLLTRGKSRVIFLCGHLLLIVACYYLSSLPSFTRFIPAVSRTYRYLDHVQTLVVVGLSIGAAIIFQSRIYTSEREKAEMAQNELCHRDKLLSVVNQAAGMLLSSESEYLEKTLLRAMEVLALCVDADRMYIWKKRIINGTPKYNQEYEWLKNSGSGADALKVRTGVCYLEKLHSWEALFACGQCVNSPVAELPGEDREFLSSCAIRSILAIPVYLQEKFWGFVSFDDCHQDRFFSKDEISILRSGSLLLANAVVRNTNETMLGARLKQQELMSGISQRFISREPVSDLILGALGRMGEFMKVTRILVFVTGMDNGEREPAYAWFSHEKWKLCRAGTGFDDLVNSSFPQNTPETGVISAVRVNDLSAGPENTYRPQRDAGLKSFIWAPMYIDGRLWGVLSVEECEAKRNWSESDAQLAVMVSSAIAGAVARDLMDKERTAALEQAMQASKAKGDFLSNMSHEMRTPMNAIIGMTAIGKNADDIEKKDYAFGKIEDASSHLLGVINDILDMSKIEANKLELSSESFDFEKMLQKVVNVINFRVDERQQSFYVTIDKRIPRILVGDDQRLGQVITNLLSNAVKFTPEQGTVRLNAQLLGEEDEAEGRVCTVQIEVSDTGIGISPEQQKRLFNSFEQAENNTTRKFGGTGLGLAISKRIVSMMGGEIRIESELGKGASFIFTARLKKGADTRRSLLKSGVDWSNVRILAVDDEAEIRRYFTEISRRFGIACDVAEGGESALGLLEKNGPYDIYFIDWKMPGMNGMELSSRIRKQNAEKSVVTMISGTEWGLIEDDAKKAGVDKYLAKPLFPSAIADLINECIGVKHPEEKQRNAGGKPDSFEDFRVLLAEDVEINREIVLALLEPTKISIDCAENGAEAVSMFSADPEKYDMIFMDVQMPEVDGYEATRRIRALDTPRAVSVPIVAMTANVFREDIEKALEAGMNDHVGKPLDIEEVLAKLRKYLFPNKSALTRLIKYGEANSGGDENWKYGIAWTAALETGNSTIDSQHKQIFKLTSSLAEACTRGQGAQILGEALNFLAAYTIRHFSDEEALQIQYQYPDFAAHKKTHEEFTKTIAALAAQYKTSGSSDKLLEDVNSVLVHWLVEHIKKEDFKIAVHIRNYGENSAGSNEQNTG